MKVVFSHGKESGPWGSKIKRLAGIARAHGCTVDSVDYTDLPDPDQRVERLVHRLRDEMEPFLLVGSSMGGYVALVAAERLPAKGLFLLAPALYMPGYEKQSYHRTTEVEIVHGWSDGVIPVENSIRFSQEADCTLHLIAGDHRLVSSLGVVEKLFTQFLAATIQDAT